MPNSKQRSIQTSVHYANTMMKKKCLNFYLHIRHLQKQGPEEGKLKYITGEWFYEVKSQRHQDRIHGSDIIMASMKQKKPMSVGEFLGIK